MRIRIDTREQQPEYVTKYLDSEKIAYEFGKNDVGDYCDLDKPYVVIEKKQSLTEIAHNLCSKDRERFIRELERSREQGIKVIILIMENYVKNIFQVKYWNNTPKTHYFTHTKVKGSVLFKIMATIKYEYGVDIEFATKKDFGKRVVELINNYDCKGDDKVNIRIDDEYLYFDNVGKPKKITGTIISSLCDRNPFNKYKGDIMLERLRIIKHEEIDPFYTKRGKKAEEIVRELFKSSGYDCKVWVDKEIDYDNFPDIDTFGGLIDLYITKDGVSKVVEIKSKNIKDYKKIDREGADYQEMQMKLYCKLQHCDGIMVWVFFNDYSEDCIRSDKWFNPQGKDESFNDNCKFIIREFKLNDFNDDIENCMYISKQYYDRVMREQKIALSDISKGALERIKKERDLDEQF